MGISTLFALYVISVGERSASQFNSGETHDAPLLPLLHSDPDSRFTSFKSELWLENDCNQCEYHLPTNSEDRQISNLAPFLYFLLKQSARTPHVLSCRGSFRAGFEASLDQVLDQPQDDFICSPTINPEASVDRVAPKEMPGELKVIGVWQCTVVYSTFGQVHVPS